MNERLSYLAPQSLCLPGQVSVQVKTHADKVGWRRKLDQDLIRDQWILRFPLFRPLHTAISRYRSSEGNVAFTVVAL